MLFLTGSIILSSWLTLSFKITERMGINTFQAIVFNYITCVIAGSLFNGHFPIDRVSVQQAWFPWAVVMGLAFIITFNMVGFTTQQLGVSVASVSYKLSLVIPFVFSVLLYNEALTFFKLAGIILAMTAVYLTMKRKDQLADKKKTVGLLLLPLLLFAGSGLVDTMIKYCEQRFLNGSNNNDFLITAFAASAAAGLLVVAGLLLTGRQKLDTKAVAAGIAIGLPNYFSIWCLMMVLKQYNGYSSAVLPVNNMGVVLISAVAAWFFFGEKLSPVNWAGIVLSLVAIAFIAFG